jgi:hydrogenase maturation protease
MKHRKNMKNSATCQRFLVLGMGNPLLCDDCIGLHVVESARRTTCASLENVVFKENFSGGFDLLYDLVGFHRAIIVDAVSTGLSAPGTIHEFPLSDLAFLEQDRLVFAHGISVPAIIALGMKCGYAMPEEVAIFGIETEDVSSFSMEPTACVKDCIAGAVGRIEERLLAWYGKTPLKASNRTFMKSVASSNTKEIQ